MVRYPDCKSVQQIVEKEISLNLHVLSGGNGEKYGHKPGDPLYKYESGTPSSKITRILAARTILRLLYFLTLLTHLLKNIRQYPEELMSNIALKSYKDSIEQFHTGVLREAIKAALMTVPTREEFMKNMFGAVDKKAFYDILASILKPLATLVARVWKYYQEKKLTSLE